MLNKIYFFALAVILAQAKDSQISTLKMQVTPLGERIIGGEEVVPHSLPYQANLLIDGKTRCGAVLISPNFVLTSAQCVVILTDRVEIDLGAHNISDKLENRQEVFGKTLIVHPDYDYKYFTNNIALIELDHPAVFNDNVQPIKLAPQIDCNNSTCYLGQIAVSSGWGLTSDSTIANVLKSVEVKVTDLEECKRYYNNEEKVYVTDTNICTSGYQSKGTCDGDSGGPLTLDGVLIGVASFVTNYCEWCSPSVYTKVADYLDWIKEKSDVVL